MGAALSLDERYSFAGPLIQSLSSVNQARWTPMLLHQNCVTLTESGRGVDVSEKFRTFITNRIVFNLI